MINGKISDNLDYSKDSLEERLDLVKQLVGSYEDGIIGEYEQDLINYYSSHYNPHLNQNNFLSENTKMGKDLEALATYLLHSKDVDLQDDVMNDYKKKRNSRREASIDNVTNKNTDGNDNKTVFKNQKIKVTKDDRKKYPELKVSGEIISTLSKMIKNKKDTKGNPLSDKEIRRLMWIRTDIQKDEVAIKNELLKCINFKNITKPEKDHMALSYIRYDDQDIIYILLEDYYELKQLSWDDTYGYLKIILMDLEKLIEFANFEDYIIDIINAKILGKTQDDIIKIIKEKYGITLRKSKLSELTKYTIPKRIVETYKQIKEDWVYTFVFKGDYKKCLSCNKNYLATTKYFNLNKTNNGKSVLRPICKTCRSKKMKLSKKSKK